MESKHLVTEEPDRDQKILLQINANVTPYLLHAWEEVFHDDITS